MGNENGIVGIDIAELGERYEEKGFFSRVKDMSKGLRRPRATREYKEARIELQRMSAPLVALVAVSLFAVALCVVTSVQASNVETVEITISRPDDVVDIDDQPEPEPEIDPTAAVPDVDIDFSAEDPSLSSLEMPSPDPGVAPDKVAIAKSPVVASFVEGSVRKRGIGGGDGGGFGSQIGSGGGQNLDGALIGTIIDFKRNADGTPRREYNMGSGYWEDVRSLVAADFGPAAMSRFFVPNKRVALTHLWVPPQSAENGPKAFGVEKYMDPSGFAVYYVGSLKSNEDRKFRLWGYFDDMLLVRIDGRVVLEYEWNARSDRKCPVAGWTPPDRASLGKVKCPQAHGVMNPGEWVTMKAGDTVKVEMLVGERPGGLLGGLVLVEEAGVKYPVNPDGSMILPIFSTRPLAETTKAALSGEKYKIGVDSPRFNSRRAAEAFCEGDIEIDSGI